MHFFYTWRSRFVNNQGICSSAPKRFTNLCEDSKRMRRGNCWRRSLHLLSCNEETRYKKQETEPFCILYLVSWCLLQKLHSSSLMPLPHNVCDARLLCLLLRTS